MRPGCCSPPRVDRYGQITVRCCRYSVPVHLIGRQVRVVLRSTELTVYDRKQEVARHERLVGKGAERLVLDHYLEALMRKPGAMAGSTVLEQARASGEFTATHEALWSAARRALGEPAATRALIEVLLHRHMADADVIAGMKAALSVGAFTVGVVAVEARKAADRTRQRSGDQTRSEHEAQEPVDARAAQVTSLTLRRLADLPTDPRPLPTLEAYDQLLHHRRPGTAGGSVS